MRFRIFCDLCPTGDGRVTNEMALITAYNDIGSYEFTCARGHQFIATSQTLRFENLFDIGSHAILDGYFREAVTSFAASLERFFEFYVEVFSHQQGLDHLTYEKAWKLIRNQSERQYGAYVFAYLARNRKLPAVLSDDNVAVRNAVVHKGKIPSRAEALTFGQNVMDIVLPEIKELRATADESFRVVLSRSMHNSRKNLPPPTDNMWRTFGFPTVLGVSLSVDGNELEDRLANLAMARASYWK